MLRMTFIQDNASQHETTVLVSLQDILFEFKIQALGYAHTVHKVIQTKIDHVNFKSLLISNKNLD